MNPTFWHIDIGNVLTILGVGGPLVYGILKWTWVLGEFPPHKHDERTGVLKADGVSFPRTLETVLKKLKPQAKE